jgi:ABC-type branched-subunit amino acid transport system substrate-binding protein
MKIGPVKQRAIWITALAVALTTLLLFTACAPGPPVEEEKVVKVGMIAPLTGAPAAAVDIAWRNVLDYLSYFKNVGVPGLSLPPDVSIDLLWGDSAFQVPQAISIYERMREQNVLLIYAPSPVEGAGLKSRTDRDGMVNFVMSIDESMMYPPSSVFTVYPTDSESFAVACDWIMENWQEGRPPRLAIMGTDSPSGHAPEVMGTAYAKSIGIQMLPFETVPYMPLDVTPQLLRLEQEGADFAYIQSIWATAIPVLKNAERLGLTDKIRFGGMENSQSVPLIDAAGSAAEGYWSPRRAPWYEETPILFDILRTVDGKLDTGGDGACTLLFVPVWIQAINIAIENVGYENLDCRAVTEAMYSIKDFDPHHIGRPVTYTPEDHRGSALIRVYEVRSGDVAPVTEWQQAPMLVPEK